MRLHGLALRRHIIVTFQVYYPDFLSSQQLSIEKNNYILSLSSLLVALYTVICGSTKI